MAETMTKEVVSTDGPNENGWYEVEFTDGSKASTKDEDVAKAAFQARGTEAEVVIGSQTKGKFTNVYLNTINGVGGRPAAGSRPKAAAAAPRSGGRSPQENERIARQWAVGRAVELLIAAGGPTLFPLPEAEFENLKLQAQSLLELTKN